MKRIILLVAFVMAACVASADDSYLWWMADTATDTYQYGNYNEVRVRAFQDGSFGNYLNLYTTDYTSLGTEIGETDTGGANVRSTVQDLSSIGFYAALGSSCADGYSYVVELWNDGKFLAESGSLAYSNAAQNDYIQIASAAGTISPATGMWAAGTFHVPEPNSALLMALGFAAMALRRRKTIKA